MDIMTQWIQRLSHILRVVDEELARGLADGELSGAELLCVLHVCQTPGLSQDKLAAQLGVDGSTVTRRMAALESKGYIARHRNPEDRRQWLITPTDRAFEILPQAVELMGDVQAALTRGMSYEDIELLQELIGRTAHNASRMQASRENEE